MITPFIKNVNFFELAKFISLQKKSILPKEYKQIDYLESSGSQYIITNFVYDFGVGISDQPKYDISITCSCDSNKSSCGAYWGGERAFNLLGLNGVYHFYAYSNNSSIATNIPIGDTSHVWEYHDYSLYCDGVLLGTAGKQSPGGGLRAVYLFSMNNSNAPAEMGGIKRIYHFSAKSNDNAICDMYPCIRKSDNKPGMYDLITEQFFTNSGTGEFITG